MPKENLKVIKSNLVKKKRQVFQGIMKRKTEKRQAKKLTSFSRNVISVGWTGLFFCFTKYKKTFCVGEGAKREPGHTQVPGYHGDASHKGERETAAV